MNGADHYREAEELLDYVYSGAERDGAPLQPHELPTILARAQIHATLALAAAQALPTVTRFMGDDKAVTDWGHALGWQPPFAAEANEVDF